MEWLSPEVIAAVVALFSGLSLKSIQHWLGRSKEREDTATEFRKELREEVKNLRGELKGVEDELDEWRTKYFALIEECNKVKLDRDTALAAVASLQHAAEDARKATEALATDL